MLGDNTMIQNEYQAFKSWLTSKIALSNNYVPQDLIHDSFNSVESYFIAMLFSINRIIAKYFSDSDDLFVLINNNDFDTILSVRKHYRNRITEDQNHLLALCFEYLNSDYKSYEEFEITQSLLQHAKSNILYIHQGNIVCLRYKHPIEDVNANIVTDLNQTISTHASHCKKCNINFIRKEEFVRLRARYPFLIANFCELSSDGYSRTQSYFSEKSPLMICGYNVKDGNLSKVQRHL
jgi:phosphatidylserine/phosphatidylglycerophosphate/cardiolipin synthase-like enzyme